MSLIHEKMARVMAEVTAIRKNKSNAAQGFKYRGIDDVYNALNPLLAKHEIFMTSEVLSHQREERQTAKGSTLLYSILRMRYHFHAIDGTSVATETIGEGMDSGDKASNKGMAVAHKYALLQAFGIPTEDMPDPDAEVHHVKPGVHKPVDGAMESLGIEGQTKIRTLAGVIADWMALGSPEDAYQTVENAALDVDEKVALWSLLDSKTRSAITKAKNAMNAKLIETQA